MAAEITFGSAQAADKEAPASIQIAAGDGLLQIVQQFVGSGVSVDAADEHGHAAASYGETEVLKWLLQSGANPNAVDSEAFSAMQSEIPIDHQYAQIDIKNKLGMYPIQTIAANEDDDTAEAMLSLYEAAGIALPSPLVPPNYQYGEMVDGAPFVDDDGDVETAFPDA